MLLELSIDNFAIVESCRLRFEEGLTVLTGETGAGKSIIVDALSACLGSRVDGEGIRDGAGSARLEAVFSRDATNGAVEAILQDRGVEPGEDLLILSREVHRSGRTVARVNGRTLPASVLAELAELLVDVHGQSEHLSLLRPGRQLDLLDQYGHLDGERKVLAVLTRAVGESRERLRQLEVGQRDAAQRLDLLRFQVTEIESANLRPGEQEELLRERIRLGNAEKLTTLAASAYSRLQGDGRSPGAIEELVHVAGSVVELASIDGQIEETARLATELRYQAEDLAAAMRRYRDSIEFDPARLDAVEGRLDEINRLERKYGETVEEVVGYCHRARAELELMEDYDHSLERLEQEVAEAEQRAGHAAAALSLARRAAADRFTEAVRGRLLRLGLGPAGLEIRLDREPSSEDGLPVAGTGAVEKVAFGPTGIDRIQLLVSLNPGEPLRPLERVASGGETARFMLAIKAALADSDDVPTLILDEIDTGVGGRSGDVVGAMLQELARSHQVITITHLPQIAARADHHLKVLKTVEGPRTSIRVDTLNRRGRLEELAEMLRGAHPSEIALKSAEELLTGAPRIPST